MFSTPDSYRDEPAGAKEKDWPYHPEASSGQVMPIKNNK